MHDLLALLPSELLAALALVVIRISRRLRGTPRIAVRLFYRGLLLVAGGLDLIVLGVIHV